VFISTLLFWFAKKNQSKIFLFLISVLLVINGMITSSFPINYMIQKVFLLLPLIFIAISIGAYYFFDKIFLSKIAILISIFLTFLYFNL
jgi:hypothetical protein